MVELIGAIVLGAIQGVVADRVWKRFAKRLRLEFTISHFHNHKGEEGLTYLVRNVGDVELRQIRIGVWHPSRGMMSAFYAEDNGPLLPAQTREYQCTLFKYGAPSPFLKYWLTHEGGEFVAVPKFAQFLLRITMEDSELVTFESKTIGVALARAWHRSLVLNKPPILSLTDQRVMSSPRSLGGRYGLMLRH